MTEARLMVLWHYIRALGVEEGLNTPEGWGSLHHAVYLAQLRGPDLGHRFRWTGCGPQCDSLARDIALMLAEQPAHAGEYAGKKLRADVLARLAAVRPLLAPPPGCPLARAEWLELAASADYLRRVSGLAPKRIESTLRRNRPLLADHLPAALNALREHRVTPP